MAIHETRSGRIFELFVQSGPAAVLVELPRLTGPRERWIRGAALGALGQYGLARAALEPLAADPGRHGSLAASTLASHLRQLGRHGEARGYDERALAAVEPSAAAQRLADDGGTAGADTVADALFDARLGLAADAVGLADVTAARALLRAAEASEDGGWRRGVRLGWVRTEIALLDGDPLKAVDLAATALALARTAPAPRHEAKCLLFLGASLDAAGAAEATEVLGQAARGAGALGAVPLLWVAEMLLATRARRRGDMVGWRAHMYASRAAVTAIGAALPDYDRIAWLNRADIARIVVPVEDGAR